jgi:GT2 family glycosyltransferase
MPEHPFVSIVVPTFRNPGALRETLASLRQLDYQPDRYELVIVDDGSEDETSAVVGADAAELPLVRYHTQDQAGAAAARNQGARLATGEVLIFVDDDMLVPSTLIIQHLRALEAHAPAVISGYREFAPELAARLRRTPFGRFRLEVEPRQEWGEGYEERAGAPCVEPLSSPAALTANDLAVRREDFFRIGGFDEEFPHAGYEDQEFAVRAAQAGYACLINYELVAWHNDRRLTLREFGERQRRGAMTAVLLASKYPERYRDRALFRENDRISPRDPATVIAKKLAKGVLSTSPGRAALFALVGALERVAPDAAMLRRLFTMITGVYIYIGVREGLTSYAL